LLRKGEEIQAVVALVSGVSLQAYAVAVVAVRRKS